MTTSHGVLLWAASVIVAITMASYRSPKSRLRSSTKSGERHPDPHTKSRRTLDELLKNSMVG